VVSRRFVESLCDFFFFHSLINSSLGGGSPENLYFTSAAFAATAFHQRSAHDVRRKRGGRHVRFSVLMPGVSNDQ